MAVVKWASTGRALLDDLYGMLSKRENGFQQMEKLNLQLVDCISLLEFNPKMGKAFKRAYRSIIFGKYRVVYNYEEECDELWIVGIFHVSNPHYCKPWNLSNPELEKDYRS